MAGFRLASLLKVRRIQEDQAAAELTQARQSARRVQRRAADERELLEDLGGQSALAAAGIARASAARQLAEIRSAQQVADGEVEAAERALTLARQSLRSVELLKERHDENLRGLQARAEQHLLDELASAQHARRTAARTTDPSAQHRSEHHTEHRTEGES